MSYIDETYKLKVEAKEDANWTSRDTDYVEAKLKALEYELEKEVGDKFEIEFKSY